MRSNSATKWSPADQGVRLRCTVLLALSFCVSGSAICNAQSGEVSRPTVGVSTVTNQEITERKEYLGRIEAQNKVNVVARVTAFLDKRLFIEGAEVKAGQQLYTLQREPFEADLRSRTAAVAQLQATLENARLTADRARTLLPGPAGQQSVYDAAIANQRSLEAQVDAAQAAVKIAQINLDYTEIKAAIDGKIGRTAVTEGNVVGQTSGTLTTIVSQDPMYVSFSVPVRDVMDLRSRYAEIGGFDAVVLRARLPDGSVYGEVGKLDFINNTVAQNTDTIALRGTIANPRIPGFGAQTGRRLADGEFVSVFLDGAKPVAVLTVPRAALMLEQGGDYVFVVDPKGIVRKRKIELGQSTKTMVSVTDGLKLGEHVVVDGIQKVRDGQAVAVMQVPDIQPPIAPPSASRMARDTDTGGKK